MVFDFHQGTRGLLAIWITALLAACAGSSPPASPGNFSAAPDAGGIRLSWGAVEGASGYTLERGPGNKPTAWTALSLSPANATQLSDADTRPNSAYTYRLRAVGGAGASGWVSLSLHTPPAAPTGFSASAASSRSVSLGWEATEGVGGYRLERGVGSAPADWTAVVDTPTSATSHTDSTPSPGTLYSYRVQAVGAGGGGAWAVADVTTPGDLPPPNAPRNLQATPAGNALRIDLDWLAPDPDNATRYIVERRNGGGPFERLASNLTLRSYSDTAIGAGNTYTYRVLAANATGEGPGSLEASATALRRPGAPSDFALTPSVGSITLNWTVPISGGAVVDYVIERRVGGNNDPTGFTTTATDFTDTGLAPNTLHRYTLRARNPAGTSDPVELSTTTASNSANVSGLYARVISATTVRLVWRPVSSASGYSVLRGACGTGGSATSVGVTQYDDAGITAGGSQTYCVRTVTPGGISGGTAITVSLTPPAIPSAIFTNMQNGDPVIGSGTTNTSWMSVRVQWNDSNPPDTGPVSGPVTLYRLERRQGAGVWQAIYPVRFDGSPALPTDPNFIPGFRYGDSGVASGQTYTYRVRAENAFGASAWQVGGTITVPSAAPVRTAGCRAGSSNQGSVGCFGALFDWPLVATHAALLTNGQVISWYARDANGTNLNEDYKNYSLHDHSLVALWNPDTGVFTRADNPNTDLFCAGFVSLPDGRFYSAGGNIGNYPDSGPNPNWSGFYPGASNTDIFDPATNTWSKGPAMANGRWYPTMMTLSNGELLIMGGNPYEEPLPGETERGNPDVEVWNTGSNSIRTLTGANVQSMWDARQFHHYYPWLHQAPNGLVFLSGRNPRVGYLDPRGSGAWVGMQNRPDNANRVYGTSVMFRPGEVFVLGGGLPASNSTALFALQNSSNAFTIRAGPPMAQPRTHLGATLMADGKVFVNGGNSDGANWYSTEANAGPQRTSEIWTPPATNSGTGSFVNGPAAQVRRIYHSTALLLPDATVLTAGSGGAGVNTAVNMLNAEIYYPAYLFNPDGTPATRPAITAAPTSAVAYASSFNLTVGATDTVSRVTFVKLGSSTHAFNMGQHFVELGFTQAGSAVSVTAPASGSIAPPGHYLLFVFNSSGVPSLARKVAVR